MYNIYDNFLPVKDLINLQTYMFGENFSWYLTDGISYDNEQGKNFYFTHVFYINDNKNSDFYYLVQPIVEKLKVKALMRIKGNMYVNNNKFTVHTKHVDYDFEHKGAIFYVNNNNGYTTLEDGTKINSVANRLLTFNPGKLHSSSNCTDSGARVTINFNFF